MMYFKMLGFYFCEFMGSFINLIFSIFKVYPSLDLGIKFLIRAESQRVLGEMDTLDNDREGREKEAASLKESAYGNE